MAVDDGYTVALLHMDGADASTTFTDESGKSWTANGNAQIDTAQSKFGGASYLGDGTGDYLTGTDSADFDYAGDFTVDFWMRPNSLASTPILYDQRPSATNGLYPMIWIQASILYYYTNSADRITGTTTLSTGTWYHVALARSGTSTKLFLNGTQEGSTYSDSNSYINGASAPVIGGSGFSRGTLSFNGWIDEVRVSKGIARWTTTFTPPTSAYAPVFTPGVIFF